MNKMNFLLAGFFLIILATIIGCHKKEDISKIDLDQLANKSTLNNPVEISLSKHINAGYKIVLNDSIIKSQKLYLEHAGYYQLTVSKNNETDTLLFVILDPERGEAEWGLKKWTPKLFAESIINPEEIRCIYPSAYISGIKMPIVFFTESNSKKIPKYHIVNYENKLKSFNIKRGIGSVNILIPDSSKSISFSFGNFEKQIITDFTKLLLQELENEINGNLLIEKFSLIKLYNNLKINKNSYLEIGEGSVILLGEGVNIENYGVINIHGTNKNPVVFTCNKPDKLWGGFISTEEGNSISISNALITQSGYHESSSYQYGHAKRQALFYLENSSFNVDSCYFIDNPGQIFYPVNSTLVIKNSIIQRTKTGGQINNSNIIIDNCIFTDFPDDNQQYLDEDNDCLYINKSNATILNSTFMYAKDDGIDSGASEEGEIIIKNSHFEASFHEGLALSSGYEVIKIHNISNCTITNCGQGIELGYSSHNHIVTIDSCFIYHNNIGIRYGDNYTWQHSGTMIVKNSRITDNSDKDIWNMLRENWAPQIEKMVFENTVVSKEDPNYPDLIIE